MHRPRGLDDPGGWGTGQDPGLLQLYPEHGSATVRGRALDLRVISPASVSPGVRGYGNTAQLSLGCRALPVELPRPRISPAGRYRSCPAKLDTRGLQSCCATKKEGLALQDASAESLCQNEPRRTRVRAENWLLQVSEQCH